MPLLKDVAVIKHSNKANKDKNAEPYNDLTAALAKEEAVADIKKDKTVVPFIIKLLIVMGIVWCIFKFV